LQICNEPRCGSRGPARQCIHQISDYFWLCANCYKQRQDEQARRRLDRTLLDWSHKESVDNVDEAINYFAWLQADRKYDSFFKMRAIEGSYGIICQVVEIKTTELDPFKTPWEKLYGYYVCYNREYLPGYKAISAFERVPRHYGSGLWQTFHWHIVTDAVKNWKRYYGLRIVLVNASKRVYYIDPVLLHKWATEYECQRYPPGENLLECSIPISKLETRDPFTK